MDKFLIKSIYMIFNTEVFSFPNLIHFMLKSF